MTYEPKPVDTRDIQLPGELMELTEKIAENVHEVWAEERLKQGWRYGPARDDEKKETPCLVPYGALPEAEKDYDRQTALSVLKLITAMGYRIEKK